MLSDDLDIKQKMVKLGMLLQLANVEFQEIMCTLSQKQQQELEKVFVKSEEVEAKKNG